MPINRKGCLFVYGYSDNVGLFYIGKTNNLLDRFSEHFNNKDILSDYLKYLMINNEKIELSIFGYYDYEIAGEIEKKLIRENSEINNLLNHKCREIKYRNSNFVKWLIRISDDIPFYGYKIPKIIREKIIIIQNNYFKRYATIEEN